MPQIPSTIYANVVKMRATAQEFVLEFGATFPDNPKEGHSPPADYEPGIRVVLPVAALSGLLKAMQQVATQHHDKQSPSKKPS